MKILKRANKRRFISIIAMIICFTLVFTINIQNNANRVEAKASKDALIFLKGTWHTGCMPGYKVKFTSKYVKYYTDCDEKHNPLPRKKIGKLSHKNKIIYTKKKSGNWIIKIKGKYGNYYYKSEGKKTLWFYGKLGDVSTYSGSSSLDKIGR